MQKRMAAYGVACTLALVVAGPARAELFEVTGVGGGTTVVVRGESLIDLVDDAVNRQAQFLPLAGTDARVSLTYAGLPNAVNVSINAAGTSATLTLATGFTRTFTAANEQALQDQVEDFIKKEGSAQWASLLKLVNEQTLAGVVDGNPFATTAILARGSFDRYGLLDPATSLYTRNFTVNGAQGDASGGFVGFQGFADVADTDAGDNRLAGGEFFWGVGLFNRLALVVAATGAYQEFDGSQAFHGGIEVGLPIVILSPEQGVLWQVTPAVSGGVGGSADLAAGGLIWGVGGTSTVAFPVGPFTLSIANQFTVYNSVEVSVDDYTFDADVQQEVLINGARLALPIGDEVNLFTASVFVGGRHTLLLEDAAVDSWAGPEAGVGLAMGGVKLAVGYRGQFGDGFDSHGVLFELVIKD